MAYFHYWFGVISPEQAHAALSPEAQQNREETVILDTVQFQGNAIHRITMYEIDNGRHYIIEADCFYAFVVDYPALILNKNLFIKSYEFGC